MRTMLKSKIHRARVTRCNVDYEGSITIDKDLTEAADLLPYEKVDVLNINNGARFHTYVIEGERGSGEICLNGAAARLVAYHVISDDEVATTTPRLIYVDSENRIVDTKGTRDWTKDLLSTL
jgi:aspartate 1-decarboxylase